MKIHSCKEYNFAKTGINCKNVYLQKLDETDMVIWR